MNEHAKWILGGLAAVVVLYFLFFRGSSSSDGSSMQGPAGPPAQSDALQETLAGFARDLGLAKLQAEQANLQTQANLRGLQIQADANDRAIAQQAGVARNGQWLNFAGTIVNATSGIVQTILSGRGGGSIPRGVTGDSGGSLPAFSGGGSGLGGFNGVGFA